MAQACIIETDKNDFSIKTDTALLVDLRYETNRFTFFLELDKSENDGNYLAYINSMIYVDSIIRIDSISEIKIDIKKKLIGEDEIKLVSYYFNGIPKENEGVLINIER